MNQPIQGIAVISRQSAHAVHDLVAEVGQRLPLTDWTRVSGESARRRTIKRDTGRSGSPTRDKGVFH